MPEIVSAPPESFVVGSKEWGVRSLLLSNLSIWDSLYSLFDSGKNLPATETSIEPFQTTNYALGMPTQQSTSNGAGPERAVDGNTDGNWYSNSVTHTAGDAQPWWQVDLGQIRQINSVKLWNRTDCCQERLNNFYLLVSDNPFTSGNLAATLAQSGVSAYQVTNGVNIQIELAVNRSGRYIRVQLMNQDILSLAEVQVLGGGQSNLPNPALSRARLSPKNQTGGTSLYSRNFGWGTGLAGLPGRGLDAGFGISYNSLIWLKDGSNIVFNPNNDNLTPGFRFGFPVVEPNYTDPLTGKNTHLMVTPSGARVEFRQVDGSTDTFETADSSYIQLKKVDANNLTITGTDGTNAYYQLKNGAFYCASVKDANGNFITINHDTNGRLNSVTDTLGRVINVNYDVQGSLTSITQARSTGTFTFATFTYANQTISPNFSGLNLVGIANGASVKVLQKITYSDSSFTQFEYNAFGQVWWIKNHAPDGHQLNYTALNFAAEGQAQTDCPRLALIRNWAENFNLNTSGQPQEVSTYINYYETYPFTLPNGTQSSGTLAQIVAPNGVHSNNFFGNSGWNEGLPIQTDDYTFDNNAWNRRRWNWTNYTQDNPALNYILNPRAIESKVGDATNTKRTTIEYHTQAGNPQASQWGLVKEVVQYDADQNTPLKRIHTEYSFDTQYTSRRILGMVADVRLSDQNNALMSRTTFNYDEGNFSEAGQNIAPINHDTANYGANFTYRGNLTSTTRWDATDAFNAGKSITARVKYNTAGNPVSSLDPLNREVKTSYTDSFDDNQNRNSFAYPTQITDPANNSSTVKYRFDFGANVYAQSPAPAGQSVGKQTSRIYDALGRLEKEIVLNTGAYSRYVYPGNGFQSIVYSTITDVNNNGVADTADEVYSDSFADGAGRTRVTRTEHPGSAGGWSVSITEFDIMGRVKRQSVPTEVDGGWQPAGDDATRGFLWTSQEYDWKGRVTRQINTDGTDKLISYEGCGCAGGQVTTIQGEQLAEGRRRQKVYEDILGRTYKSETLNWDGSVYSTSKTFFNGRDQVTLARQYAGADNSSTFQDTLMTYDGYGRLKTQHRPEQNEGTATTYNYYADDRIQQVVDARGATVDYSYDNRGLTTQVSTTSPNPSTIPVTPTVNYSYDNLGNRTSMTDGMGNTVYEYDQLSRLTAETRQFNDSMPNAPLGGNRFRVEYAWTISSSLKSYTDPWGQQINYSQDKVGRMSSISGSSFGGVTNYATNPQYRAWGALKHLEYGNNDAYTNITYDNRLSPQYFETIKPSNGNPNIVKGQYEYYADGNLKKSFNPNGGIFDRSYTYDYVGRVKDAKSGAAVYNVQNPYATPYEKSYLYDPFGNMVARKGVSYLDDVSYNYNPATQAPLADYVNNRKAGATYDAEGNTLNADQQTYIYTSNSQLFKAGDNTRETEKYYDGDGLEVKRQVREKNVSNNTWEGWLLTYRLKSSVFGKDLGEISFNGTKGRTYVFNGGSVLAVQETNPATEPAVRWQHEDPSGKTTGYTRTSTIPSVNEELDVEEMALRTVPPDPNTGSEPGMLPPANGGIMQSNVGDIDAILHGGCFADGMAVSCATANSMLERGAAEHAPEESIGDSVRRLNAARAKANQQAPTLKYAPKRTKQEYAVLRALGSLTPSEDGQLGQQQRRNPCERMADRAQQIANEAIQWGTENNQNSTEILNIFDRSQYLRQKIFENLKLKDEMN